MPAIAVCKAYTANDVHVLCVFNAAKGYLNWWKYVHIPKLFIYEERIQSEICISNQFFRRRKNKTKPLKWWNCVRGGYKIQYLPKFELEHTERHLNHQNAHKYIFFFSVDR